ncbi:MAG: FAD-binding protein [Polyangiaceae bacterium]
MHPNTTRRAFLSALATATAILAFSPATRAWVTTPDAACGSIPIPKLDGQLVLAAGTLAAASSDFGRFIHRTPAAVLYPGSVDDIRAIVKFARKHDIPVGGMSKVGNTHSVYGQSQVEAGIVIHMASLDTIHEIGQHSALVDAGVRWRQLLLATTPLGKTPPSLADHLDLSVGGTLSGGGVGGATYAHGMIVDNALELQVVTGKGDLVTCSPTHKADLFHSVLGGMGQCGIIVRARVRLIPALSMSRRYTAIYAALGDMMADQEMLIDEARFEHVEGFAIPGPSGWQFQIEAVKHYDPASPPDDGALTGDLAFDDGTLVIEDSTYYDFANRLEPLIAFLETIGVWQLPHPWIDLFVPGSQAETFIQSALDNETEADLGGGPILIYPFHRASVTTPLVALPDEPIVYLFSLLRTSAPDAVPAYLAKNRAVYEACRDIGGKRYAPSGVPFTKADWKDHFGSNWLPFRNRKHHYDPRGILTPGPGIFG